MQSAKVTQQKQSTTIPRSRFCGKSIRLSPDRTKIAKWNRYDSTLFCPITFVESTTKCPCYPHGYRVGVNSSRVAGIVGGLQWHEVTKDERVVGKALGEGEVLPVLRSEKLDESSGDCEWCRYVRMRVDPSGGRKSTIHPAMVFRSFG